MFALQIKESLLILALVAGIPLGASCALSLIVAFMQAATQIQEQTLSHLVRLLSVAVTLIALQHWFLDRIIEYIQRLLGSLALLGRMSG